MTKRLFTYLISGLLFVRNNAQVLYVIFLIVVIPFAFIVSGQKFLSAAKGNQERLEKERLRAVQDIFVELAQHTIDTPALLQGSIERLKEQDFGSLTEFKIVVFDGNEYKVIGSLDKNELGTIDKENQSFYTGTGVRTDSSMIFEVVSSGRRHWKVVRAIPNQKTGGILGIMLMDISMAMIDDAAVSNIKNAYIQLFFIVLAISVLLVRQAKIIDYGVRYRKLKELDQMKDDFISMAAHELRTPLTVVRGYAEMLSSSKNLGEDDQKDVFRITTSINQLTMLINDILDVIRLGRGLMVFNKKNIDISTILEDVVESFQHVAHEKGLRMTYEKNKIPLIYIDKEKLRDVFINIIGNSIKYTPTGSVEILVEDYRDILSIRVRDTGIGISAEDQKRLFEKFFRVQSLQTEDIRGTGLGLWIAAQIVSQMGGKISVESIKGKGTDFVISFPIIK